MTSKNTTRVTRASNVDEVTRKECMGWPKESLEESGPSLEEQAYGNALMYGEPHPTDAELRN